MIVIKAKIGNALSGAVAAKLFCPALLAQDLNNKLLF